MFVLRICLTPRIEGLKALDERRRLGLPDDSRLGSDSKQFTVDVSEKFARTFADVYAEYNDMEIDVPSSWFKHGELKVDKDDDRYVDATDLLTEERLIELAKAWMAEEAE